MSAVGASHPILQRLQRLRATLRRRLFIYGVCAVASGGVYALLVIILLDWWLAFPPLIRAGIDGLFVLGFAMAALHWVVRPLRARLAMGQIAAQLERRFRGLDDRLVSAVHFLTEAGEESAAMRNAAIAQTQAALGRLRLTDSLTLRPMLASMCLLVFSVGLLASLLYTVPEWLLVGVGRYAAPSSGLAWPRRVEIIPFSGHALVAHGESVTLSMRVVRGGHPRLRGVVHLRRDDGQVTTLALNRLPNDLYSCTLEHVTEPMDYWFEAGDHNTRARRRRITVVQRPDVTTMLARVHPPVYAPDAPLRELDLAAGGFPVVRRSRVALSVTASKPLATEPAHPHALILDDGERIPLAIDRADPRRLTGALVPDDTVSFRVQLTDRSGFSTPSGQRYTLPVVPDAAPDVVILEPMTMLEVTPRASVPMQVEARDDLGIATMSIALAIRGHDPREQILPVTPTASSVRDDGVQVIASPVLHLAELDLEPGDVVDYQATVEEVSAPGVEGRVARSSRLQLTVISHEAFARRLREELARIEDRLRTILLAQEQVRRDTGALIDGSEDRHADEGGAGAIKALGQRQEQLARALRAVQDQLAGVHQRAATGLRAGETALERAGDLADEIGGIAADSMPRAVRQLDRALQKAGRPLAIAEATTAQDEIIAALRRALQALQRWSDVQQVVERTQQLLDRQQRLRQDTLQHERTAMGKRPDALNRSERESSERIAREQDLLSDDVRVLLDQTRTLAELGPKMESGAAGLEDVLRVAQAQAVQREMKDAARAVEANRTSAARLMQRNAERGLSEMLAVLRSQEARRLERLVKHIHQAADLVGMLLEEQRGLHRLTVEALQLLSEPTLFMGFGPRQAQLAGSAAQLADDWTSDDALARHAPALARAAGAMREASTTLFAGEGSSARDTQQVAVNLLEQLYQRLAAEAAETGAQARQQQLAQLALRLANVHEQQRAINQVTAEVRARIAEQSGLDRIAARKAAMQARRQDGLAEDCAGLGGELAEAQVYAFIIERVVEGMRRSADALGRRKVDDALAEVQGRVERDLAMLRQALADMYRLPNADTYERGGGGGGGGGQGGTAGEAPHLQLPALAELLVLRAMQQSLNEETRQTAEAIDSERPTEQDLERIRGLAEEQERVRELTADVMERAGRE